MDIVEEIRQNPEKGAHLLENEYKAGLMTLALRFCPDPSDAEELVNHTFAEVVAGIDGFLEQSAFFTWMCRILVRCHAKDMRRKARRNEVPNASAVESAVDEDAGEQILREVDAGLLRDAIEELPPDIRRTVVMHYFLDVPVREAARVLAVPVGTVGWRLHYARMLLAAKLGATAKKPGAKALLLVLALGALTALGAGAAAAITRLMSPPPASLEQQADNDKAEDPPQEDIGVLPQDAFAPDPVLPLSPVPPVFSTLSSTSPSTTEQELSMKSTSLLASVAAASALAAQTAPLLAPAPAQASWFDSPEVAATVSSRMPDGSDPHYINLSEDGAYLLVDWHSSNTAFPVELYSVAALKAASGDTKRLAMATALADDFFGAGTSVGGWKGGAVSAKLAVAIPGSGKSSGALYTAFAVPAFGWKTNENAFALSGFGDAGFDGLDFNAAGTRLYVNQYADGNRNKILAYDTAALKSSHTLSLLSTKTVEGVSRIRNLSCYTVKGKDLIYFGEGAVSGSNNSVYVYDPAEDTMTALVTDATLFDDDIMNVKLSHVATGCPTLYVQTDDGKLYVFLLAPDGKSVTSAKPVKSFTAAQCATLCGLSSAPSNPKFRNFEVTDDGSAAFFLYANGGLCVVKSGYDGDAYISAAPNSDVATTKNVLFTDYFFGPNSRIEVDYAYNDTTSYGFVFSPWEANSVSRSGIWRNGGTYTYFVGNRNDGIASVKLNDTERHVMCIDAAGMKGFIATDAVTNEVDFSEWHSDRAGTQPITFSNCNWPIMFLGAANGSKTAVNTTHYARAKIYGAKIYESGTLVRDYVPAIVNGIPCLYDRVNGSIAAETRDGFDLPCFGGNVARLAGDLYAQIATSGTKADMGINTGYKMKPTSRVEVDCRPPATTGDYRVLGAWNGAPMFTSLIWLNSGIITFFINQPSSGVSTELKAGTERQTLVLDIPALKSYVIKQGAVHKVVSHSVSAPTVEAGRPLAFFADCNNDNGTSFQSPAVGMKGYSLKILEDGVVVTNFLPTLSIAGVCFRDAITGGEITPKIPRYFSFRLDTDSSVAEGYLVNTADVRTSGINLGYYPCAQSRYECDMAVSVTANTQRPVGGWNLFSGSPKLRTLLYVTGGKFQYFLNSGTGSSTATADTERHVHAIDILNNKAQLYTGGVVVHEVSGTAASDANDRATLPVTLFADNNGSGTYNDGCYAGARFWGLKTYERGGLTQDWGPARSNGVAGVADRLTGRFVVAGANFATVGDVWDCQGDAYVESDGTQVLNTGYKAKKTSRIEVDFMALDSQSKCYFGVYGNGTSACYTYWCAPPYVRFMMANGNVDSPYRFQPKLIRHTGVIDFGNKEEYVKLGGVKIDGYSVDMSSKTIAADWECPYPMGVCGSMKTADTICTGPGPAAMRVYAVRIYESDALVHLFVPYSGADGVGLVDLLTGDKAFKHSASVADPTYVAGPLAITTAEVAAASATGPASFGIGKDAVQMVAADSVGADSYRWTRNGVLVGETADGTLGIGWRRGSAPDTFTVTPVYRTDDGEVLGTPSSFTVTYNPETFVLFVR